VFLLLKRHNTVQQSAEVTSDMLSLFTIVLNRYSKESKIEEPQQIVRLMKTYFVKIGDPQKFAVPIVCSQL
jgi:hypothetical protein